MLPSRILVATDGSPPAKAAEAFAAELAVATHASSVTVVTVLPEYVGRGTILGPLEVKTESAERLVEEAAEHIRQIMGDNSTSIETKVISSMSIAGAIVNEAHITGTCSHIVMGNRGHGEFVDLLLGSTSHAVVKGAHCPVTIIRL